MTTTTTLAKEVGEEAQKRQDKAASLTALAGLKQQEKVDAKKDAQAHIRKDAKKEALLKLVAGTDETREFFEWLSLGDKEPRLWGPLAPRATIMLNSCLAGGWTIEDGVVATDSLLTFAAPHVCDSTRVCSNLFLLLPQL